MKKRRLYFWMIPVVGVLGLSGGLAWWHARQPVASSDGGAATDDDTGMDRAQQEEMMKVIGYVQ